MDIKSIAWNIAVERIIPPPKGGDSIVREIALKKYTDDLLSEEERIIADFNAVVDALDGFVLMPSGVLDLTRFMCETWTEIDKFVYKNCQNLELYPLIQGSKTQSAIRKIGKQKFNPFAVGAGIQAVIEAQEQSYD